MKKKCNFYTFRKKTRFFNSSVWKYAQNQTFKFFTNGKNPRGFKIKKNKLRKNDNNVFNGYIFSDF